MSAAPSFSPPEPSRMATDRSLRFCAIRIKHGPCVVVDQANRRKIVASCFEPEVAEALARLMNGDVAEAMASRDAALARLGS